MNGFWLRCFSEGNSEKLKLEPKRCMFYDYGMTMQVGRDEENVLAWRRLYQFVATPILLLLAKFYKHILKDKEKDGRRPGTNLSEKPEISTGSLQALKLCKDLHRLWSQRKRWNPSVKLDDRMYVSIRTASSYNSMKLNHQNCSKFLLQNAGFRDWRWDWIERTKLR